MLFQIVISSHLIADFILQTNRIAEEKEKSSTTSIFHALIHLVTSTILLLIVFLFTFDKSLFRWQVFGVIVLVSILHFLLDTYGKKILNRIYKNNDFLVFTTDQLLHLFFIFIITFTLIPEYLFYKILKSIFIENIINKNIFITLLGVSFFILLTTFTSNLVSKLFKSLKSNNSEKLEEIKVIEKIKNDDKEVITEILKSPLEVNDFGKWIGYCERIIIFIMVFIQAYEGIAIIVALKTFARYQQLNQKSFVEKYLLGTLFSVMMSIVLGFLFRAIYLMIL